MDGAAPVIKKPGGCHHIGTRTDSPDHGAFSVKTADEVQNVAVRILAHIDAGTDKNHPTFLKDWRVAISCHLDAIARHCRAPIRAGNDPLIQFTAALPIGRAQRFDCRCKGKQRKFIQQKETDILCGLVSVILQK